MRIRFCFLIAWLFSALVCPSHAAPVLAVSIDSEETVTITVPKTQPHTVFTLTGPPRLVVDVPHIALSADEQRRIALPPAYEGRLIKGLRFGQFTKETSRLVFDLNAPAQVEGTDITETEIVIRLAGGGKRADRPKTPVIMIDPGHGGVDPGAIARGGTQEKSVVLQYARALKKRLEEGGKYKVSLTRDGDEFIRLRDRIAVARKARADLFLSLHADSASSKSLRGLSVYTLSEKASDKEAEALAAQENKADVLAGIDLGQEREDVADILISLAQRETKNRSALLADLLVSSLKKKVRLLPNTHRFAGFAVLKSPDIPSVLVELGFLSHPQEEKLLRSADYRAKAIDGIAAGIDAYFQHEREMERE